MDGYIYNYIYIYVKLKFKTCPLQRLRCIDLQNHLLYESIVQGYLTGVLDFYKQYSDIMIGRLNI